MDLMKYKITIRKILIVRIQIRMVKMIIIAKTKTMILIMIMNKIRILKFLKPSNNKNNNETQIPFYRIHLR